MRLLLCLYFASGAAALVYEVVWMRMLGAAFGVSLYANAVVLAALMGGVAIGSRVGGKWIARDDKPLRAYGLIELGLAAYALVLPEVLALVDAPMAQALRFGAAAIVIGVPSVLIGAAFPVVVRAARGELGRIGGRI